MRAGVLAVVRRMIAGNNENKVIGYDMERNVFHNSAITTADCIPLIPEISPIDSAVGNTAQQRMGDKIKPKTLTVKGVVALVPDVGTIQNILVRVVLLSQKTTKLGSQVLAGGVNTGQLLRPGIAGLGTDQVPFLGNAQELNYSINKDLFKVYMDKTFMLTASLPGANGVAQPIASARWSYTFKSLPVALTFDEAHGDWPNNFAPFYAIGYAFADGTAPDVISTRVKTNTYSKFEFEDA